MREIKFRAWHCVHGMSYPNESFEPLCGMQNFHGSPAKDFDCEDLTLMQFTGLLDKNGKEIYEGDIVHGNAEANFVVVPMCGGLSIHPLRNLGQKHNELIASPTNDPQTASWLGDSEVIGNIHENPELVRP